MPRVTGSRLREADFDTDVALYRDRTIGMLKRYGRLSIELGRLPSVLGREFFRAKVTSYRMHTFEDAVIFVHDMDRCLERLDESERTLLGKIVLQEFTREEAAKELGWARTTVERRYWAALDELTWVLLELELLDGMPMARMAARKGCQAAESRIFRVNACSA